jgi:hypothetical protein
MRSRKLRLAGRPKESEAALREAIRLHEQKGNIAAVAGLAAPQQPHPAEPRGPHADGGEPGLMAVSGKWLWSALARER